MTSTIWVNLLLFWNVSIFMALKASVKFSWLDMLCLGICTPTANPSTTGTQQRNMVKPSCYGKLAADKYTVLTKSLWIPWYCEITRGYHRRLHHRLPHSSGEFAQSNVRDPVWRSPPAMETAHEVDTLLFLTMHSF